MQAAQADKEDHCWSIGDSMAGWELDGHGFKSQFLEKLLKLSGFQFLYIGIGDRICHVPNP